MSVTRKWIGDLLLIGETLFPFVVINPQEQGDFFWPDDDLMLT
jgi:hypothetical protein